MTYFYIFCLFILVAKSVTAEPAQPFYEEWLHQAPSLNFPQESAVSGDVFKHQNYKPNARGSIAVNWSIELDQKKAKLHWLPDLSWAPGNGMSQFGIGFSFPLEIQRVNLNGEIDYKSDKLSSPFGFFSVSEDGYWYLDGDRRDFKALVKEDEITLFDSLGRTWTFKNIEVDQLNHIWKISKIIDSDRQESIYRWEAQGVDQSYISKIEYGTAEQKFYRLEFKYQEIEATPYFLNGRSRKMDKLISQIVFSSIIQDLSQPRWNWKFEYQTEPLSQIYQLIRIQKNYRDSKTEDVLSFNWNSLEKSISRDDWPHLKPLIDKIRPNNFSHQKLSFFDFDQDGRLDFELADGYQQFIQENQKFSEIETEKSPNSHPLCRSSLTRGNRARWIRRLSGPHSEPSVLAFEKMAGRVQYWLHVCTLDGSLKKSLELPRQITRLDLVRMADLNRDENLDLVYYQASKVSVWDNIWLNQLDKQSLNETDLKSSMRPPVPVGYMIQDINGDGYADLLSPSGQYLTVAHGKGSNTFDHTLERIPVTPAYGKSFNLTNNSIFPVHLNRDGLADLLVMRDRQVFVFLNQQGRLFKEIDFRRDLNGKLMYPYLVADLSGKQNGSLIGIDRDLVPFQIDLFAPGAGLLSGYENQWGIKTTMQWSYSEPIPYQSGRHLQIKSVSTKSQYNRLDTSFNWKNPKVDENGKFLGYALKSVKNHMETLEYQFEHHSLTESLLLKMKKFANQKPDFYSLMTRRYLKPIEDRALWLLAAEMVEINDSGDQIRQSTAFEHDDKLCLKKEKYLDGRGQLTKLFRPFVSEDLLNFPVCFYDQLLLNSEIDNHKKSETLLFDRDLVGRLKAIKMVHNKNHLNLASYEYDNLGRLTKITNDQGQVNRFEYLDRSKLLKKATTFDGSTVEYKTDEQTGLLRQFTQQSGERSYREFADYDARERLAKHWNSLHDSSANDPLKLIEYIDADRNRLGEVKFVQKIAKDQSQTLGRFASNGGEFTGSFLIADDRLILTDLKSREIEAKRTRYFRDHSLVTTVEVSESLSSEIMTSLPEFLEVGRKEQLGIFDESLESLWLEEELQMKTAIETKVAADGLSKAKTINDDNLSQQKVDLRGNVVEIIDEKDQVYRFNWDMLDRLQSLFLPDSSSFNVSYDGFGRPQRIQKSDLGSIVYEWDPKRNRIAKASFISRDQKIAYHEHLSYDEQGRLIGKSYTGGPNKKTYEFTWSKDRKSKQHGLLVGEKGPGYVKDFHYRADGKLEKSKLLLANQFEVTMTFRYDFRNVISSQEVHYRNLKSKVERRWILGSDFDALGKLGQLSINGKPIVTVERNELGQIIASRRGDGYHQTIDRDPLVGRMKGYQLAGPNSKLEYQNGLDDRGFVNFETFSTDQSKLDFSRIYSYDALGFLSQQAGTQTINWTYAPNQLLHVPASKGKEKNYFRFDSIGRLVQKGSLEFSWGSDNQIAEIKSGRDLYEYLYDSNGHKLAKIKNGVVEGIWFEKLYISDDHVYLPIFVESMLIGYLKDGKFHSVAANHLGNLLDRMKESDPWGYSSRNQEIDAVLYYAGHGRDLDSGLIRFGVRDYEPELGRFTTYDAYFFKNPELCVESPVECNLYSYARNNPLKYTDPTGMYVSTSGEEYSGPANPDPRALEFVDSTALKNFEPGVIGYLEGADKKLAIQQHFAPKDGIEEGFGIRLMSADPNIKIGMLPYLGKSVYSVSKLSRYQGPKPKYHVNPAHVPGMRGFNPKKTPLPKDAQSVFNNSVPNDPKSPTAWFGKNTEGQIYRYSLSNDGTAHFSGIHGVGDGVRNLTPYARQRLGEY